MEWQQFEYDSWNRITQMTYPDGEVVFYDYDQSGMLQKVSSNKYEECISFGHAVHTPYIDDIQYDHFGNRKKIAYGNNTETQGYMHNHTPYYSLFMAYTPNGKIQTKALNVDFDKQGVTGYRSYNNTYHYAAGNNQLVDVGSVQYFKWDANGNMVQHSNPTISPIRNDYMTLCWDEENRLRGAHYAESSSYYLYDAHGERVVKFAGQMTNMNINGHQTTTFLITDPTLYLDAYLVSTPKGYTKHYYAGAERIASKIGGSKVIQSPSELVSGVEYEKKITHNTKALLSYLENCPPVPVSDFSLVTNPPSLFFCNPETEYYFYHTDHLGSSSWISDQDGEAIQHLQYLPFGESWVDQRDGSWNAPYTFSGKEKDWETGYSYFGARYYDSELSIWLSVDPMAHKYPHQSNYVYCSNNPIRLIDPDGRDEWEVNPNGEIFFIKESEKHQLFAIDKNGNRTTDKDGNFVSQDVDKDMMNSITCGSDAKKEWSSMNTTGKEEMGKSLFGFLSKNTDVEWSFWGGNDGETGDGFSNLSTSHQARKDPSSAQQALLNSPYDKLSFFFHSHSRKEMQGHLSNGTDRRHQNMCKYPTGGMRGSPNAVMGIMHKGQLYDFQGFNIGWDGKRK